MDSIHYLKREKQGKIIQLWMVKEIYDEHGYHKRSLKFDIDPAYKTSFSYLQYHLPHEELTEISIGEFRELCCRYNCLSTNAEPPVPKDVSQNNLVSNSLN